MWWLVEEIENESASAFVQTSVAKRYRSFGEAKKIVWKWYRANVGRKDLSPASKLTLWAICERHRLETWSSHDSNRYYALMCGMSHKTVSNALIELASEERNIVWLADEENKTLMRKSRRGIRRHILLVGLNKLLKEELPTGNP